VNHFMGITFNSFNKYLLAVSLLSCFTITGGCAVAPSIDESLKNNALKGDAEAQFEIGEKYYKAVYSFFGDWKYWNDAAQWFELAANQGHIKAQFRLSQYYFNVLSNYERSFSLLQSPAQQGIAEAQHSLGIHYAQGWGTAHDPVLAYKWIALAFEGGVSDPVGDLANLAWLVSRAHMNTDEIAKGQRLATEHSVTFGISRSIDTIP
jgi:TPR repeat protein